MQSICSCYFLSKWWSSTHLKITKSFITVSVVGILWYVVTRAWESMRMSVYLVCMISRGYSFPFMIHTCIQPIHASVRILVNRLILYSKLYGQKNSKFYVWTYCIDINTYQRRTHTAKHIVVFKLFYPITNITRYERINIVIKDSSVGWCSSDRNLV